MSSTKTINLYRAQALRIMPVESVTIVIEQEFPHYESLSASRCTQAAEGAILAAALLQTLPGGTIDRLLIELLKHRASTLHVPHLIPDEVEPRPMPEREVLPSGTKFKLLRQIDHFPVGAVGEIAIATPKEFLVLLGESPNHWRATLQRKDFEVVP